MKNDLKKPCKECPFLKTSPEGWLGPWESPEDLHNYVMDEHDFPCHKTMGDDEKDVPESEQSRCVGSLMYMKNSCKWPRRKDLQEAMKAHDGKDRSNVFGHGEFVKHHTI